MSESAPRVIRLLHVTTIPVTLWVLRGQLQFMQRRGFDVSVLSSPGSELESFARHERVPAFAVPMTRRITPVRDLIATVSLCRVLLRIRPDIVHAHTPKAGLLGMIAAVLCRVPVRVYHVHGLPLMTAWGLRRRLLKWSEKAACSLANRVLCVSHSVSAVAVAEGLCEPEKIKVLLGGSVNGVDAAGRLNPDQFDADVRENTRRALGLPVEARVIGFVGRVVRDKGVAELAIAWRMVRDLFPDLHLLVVGPFETEDPVDAATDELLRTDPRVRLLGWVDSGDIPSLYAIMDVLVLPTHREGFPTAPLEAAAMGLPVVATRIPGCVDAIDDGITGTLVPVGDTAQLARAIAEYVTSVELRRRHGKAARDRVYREFRQEPIWEAVDAEYRPLLARQRQHSGSQRVMRSAPRAETTGVSLPPHGL